MAKPIQLPPPGTDFRTDLEQLFVFGNRRYVIFEALTYYPPGAATVIPYLLVGSGMEPVIRDLGKYPGRQVTALYSRLKIANHHQLILYYLGKLVKHHEQRFSHDTLLQVIERWSARKDIAIALHISRMLFKNLTDEEHVAVAHRLWGNPQDVIMQELRKLTTVPVQTIKLSIVQKCGFKDIRRAIIPETIAFLLQHYAEQEKK